jgi:ribonucleotide reductase beta subunit family protein with ferritin-like domain
MSVFKESIAYRPFQYSWAAEAAQVHAIDMYWDIHQIELQDDLRQYNQKDGLKTKNVSHAVNKAILDKNLMLFTEMDKTVAEGYTKFIPNIKNNEVRNMLLTFAAREVVHQRAYALAAETFGFTDRDWSVFSEYAEMREKLDVMTRSFYNTEMSVELQTAINLAQVLLGEGIGLFAAFASLLNQKRWGLLVGFNDINQWSLVDEQEHVDNNIRLLKTIVAQDLNADEILLLFQIIQVIIDAYVEAEMKYIDLVHEVGDQEGMTKDELKEYILYLKEMREYKLGMRGLNYVRANPLPWLEWLVSGAKHDNFFEKKVTDYTHGLGGKIDYAKYLNKGES